MFRLRKKGYSYDNTRRYIRLPASWPVRYEAPAVAEGGEPKVTHTADVSAGGVALNIREMLPVGSRVRVEVHIPPLDRSIRAEGVVIRCAPARRGGYGYNVGIRFEQIDPQDQAVLNEAIEQFYSPRQKNRYRGGAWWRRLP